MSEQEIIDWANKHKKEIRDKFVKIDHSQPNEDMPHAIFMAGSPGAGKTETSKRFLENLNSTISIPWIDPDEIRNEFKAIQYNGKNASLYQKGVSNIVGCALDKVFKHRISFILDGTFSKEKQAMTNIQRALDKGYKVSIFYVYQKPNLAWNFIKKREEKELRKIEKATFIEQYFESRKVVNSMKILHKNLVLYIFEKNIDGSLGKMHINVENIDSYIPEKYTSVDLENLI